jgi:hypothetical protein
LVQSKLGLLGSLSIGIIFVLIFHYANNGWLIDLYIDAKYIAFAHMPVNNASRVQEWTDTSNDVNVKFIYEPQRPIIDTFTELRFSIENATTGNHISGTDNATARVVVTNGQRIFKFENISIGNNGHFSVKYLFPDDGTHQVITRVDTNDSSTASSFNVFIPHQAPPNILNPFPSSPTSGSENNQQITMTVLLIGIIGSIAAVTIFLIRRKK